VRGVYNKAEYEPQRRHMLQEWANMVEAWIKGEKYTADIHAARLSSWWRTIHTPRPAQDATRRRRTSGCGGGTSAQTGRASCREPAG
jgi:hypothetical protein